LKEYVVNRICGLRLPWCEKSSVEVFDVIMWRDGRMPSAMPWTKKAIYRWSAIEPMVGYDETGLKVVWEMPCLVVSMQQQLLITQFKQLKTAWT